MSKGITIKVDIDTDEAKIKLNDIEQQLDRILEKQERASKLDGVRADTVYYDECHDR